MRLRSKLFERASIEPNLFHAIRKLGSLVKHGMTSVVRYIAGCAAIGTSTAFLISRRIGIIRSGSCSQFAPTEWAPDHRLHTFRWRVTIGAFRRLGTERHSCDDGQVAGAGTIQRNQHLFQVEERLQGRLGGLVNGLEATAVRLREISDQRIETLNADVSHIVLRHQGGALSSLVSSHAIQPYRQPALEFYGRQVKRLA